MKKEEDEIIICEKFSAFQISDWVLLFGICKKYMIWPKISLFTQLVTDEIEVYSE
jgi:hypothetical protein